MKKNTPESCQCGHHKFSDANPNVEMHCHVCPCTESKSPEKESQAIMADMPKEITYLYSIDEEMYYGEYSNREEALKDARIEYPDNTIYTAEKDPLSFMDLVFIDILFDDIHERAFDECGDAAGDFPNVHKDAKEDLENLIAQWAVKHNIVVNFGAVKNIQKHEPSHNPLKP